jgi:hypothetical protein
MVSLPVQAFLDHRGRNPCDLFPWDPKCRQIERFRHRRIVESDDHRRSDSKLSITDQRCLGQAVAATKKRVGSEGTQWSGNVFYRRAKEPGPGRNEFSRGKDLAESGDSALAPEIRSRASNDRGPARRVTR